MIATLPKDFVATKRIITVPDKEPVFRVELIKKGVLVYNMAGVLIGQVFAEKSCIKASIADGATYVVEKNRDAVTVRAFSAEDVKRKPARPPIVATSDYEVFGRVEGFCYTLFEQIKGEKRPFVVAEVVDLPLSDGMYRVRFNDQTNVLRAFIIVVAISLL